MLRTCVRLICAVWLAIGVLAAGATTRVHAAPSAACAPWLDTTLSADARAALVVGQMTLAEKVDLATGDLNSNYGFYNAPIDRLCIPALTMADGPAGVRIGNPAVNDGRATALPFPDGLAAAFDPALAGVYGDLLGREARATGHNVLLGPAIDIARHPRAGRIFEAFGEDPLLTGTLGAEVTRGIQRNSVMATVKHYNVYNSANNSLDSTVDERTLQEIYTRPWRRVVDRANPGAVMCSFPFVNGVRACESAGLLTDILKGQLGFEGFVMSDYGATTSTVGTANAGEDQEQPGAGPPSCSSGCSNGALWDGLLLQAVQRGDVSEARVTDMARRILRSMFRLGLFETLPRVGTLETARDAQIARDTAERAAVLLADDGGALPIGPDARSIAVIGADADNASAAGGGSPLVKPTATVSPLQGIRDNAGPGVTVRWAPGTDAVSAGNLIAAPPPVPSTLFTPPGASAGQHGLRAEWFSNATLSGTPDVTRVEPNINWNLGFYAGFNAAGPHVPAPPFAKGFTSFPSSARWTGQLTAPVTGDYTFSLATSGSSRFFLDGGVVIDNTGGRDAVPKSATVHLVAGQPHDLRVEFVNELSLDDFNHILYGSDQVRLGWTHPAAAVDSQITDAARLARDSDVAVVVVRDYESEGADRPSLALPNEQDRLISAVAAANPRTIVVLQTGGPVTMPWRNDVGAVMEAWYGGQEQGSAIGRLLFGAANPSGKLPMTFPRSESRTPVSSPQQFPAPGLGATGTPGNVTFSEGVFVGYRGYDQLGIRPLFPFGHGLSYTRFALSRLRVGNLAAGANTAIVRFRVRNTGARSGRAVVQVYAGRLPTTVATPPKQLIGFSSVALDPGARQSVRVRVDRESLSYWDATAHQLATPAGRVRILVGTSSRDLRFAGRMRLR